MKYARKFFKEFDMFSAPATLRAREQAQTSSFFAGVISFITFGLFAYVFIARVISIVQFSQISSTQTETKLLGDQVSADNIMFAIMVNYLSSTEVTKYFAITIQAKAIDVGYSIQLTACTADQWQLLGDKYNTIFEEFGLGSFLCPVSTQHLDLQGTFKKTKIKQISIQVRPCSVNTSSTCVNQTLQQQYLSDEIAKRRSLIVQLYFLDQSIDATAEKPVSYFINNDNRISFTDRRGIDNTVQFGTYQITTDTNLWPWNQYSVITGNFVDKLKDSVFEIDGFGGNPYVVFSIMMNRRMIYVTRTIGKLDEALSYVGGLFSIIISFLAFFIASFNQYRYELMVGQGSFNYNEDGKRVREEDFHFHNYIKYSVYDWTKSLLCFEPNWQYCQQIDDTRQEVNCQMDVVRLFRKIRNLQTSVIFLMSQGQKVCMTLFEPPALPQVRRNRLITQYYDAVIGGKPAVTVEDIQMVENVMQHGLKMYQNNELTNGEGGSFGNLYQMQVASEYNRANTDNEQYLKIAPDRSNILQVVLHNFPHISKEADQVVLTPQFEQIETEIARSFFEMDPNIRVKIQQKIPLKIIHRLKRKYDRLMYEMPCKIDLNI